MISPVTPADLRFINTVAVRRFVDGASPAAPTDADDATLTAVLQASDAATPFERAARLARALLQQAVFPLAPLQTALLAVHCALVLEGFTILAPQGAAVGMIRGLDQEDGDAVMARWLEDRAVPAGGG